MLRNREKNKVVNCVVGVRWDKLTENYKQLLGRWRADEKWTGMWETLLYYIMKYFHYRLLGVQFVVGITH